MQQADFEAALRQLANNNNKLKEVVSHSRPVEHTPTTAKRPLYDESPLSDNDTNLKVSQFIVFIIRDFVDWCHSLTSPKRFTTLITNSPHKLKISSIASKYRRIRSIRRSVTKPVFHSLVISWFRRVLITEVRLLLVCPTCCSINFNPYY